MALSDYHRNFRFFESNGESIGRWLGHGRSRREGFSLIEVMLAVGLIAFVLSAILGLVTLGVQGTKRADLDARLMVLTSRLSASYQSRGYTNALSELATNATTYYDLYGAPTNAAGAYFQCDAQNVTPSGNSTNYTVLRFQIRWPVPQLASSNVYVTTIGNFQ